MLEKRTLVMRFNGGISCVVYHVLLLLHETIMPQSCNWKITLKLRTAFRKVRSKVSFLFLKIIDSNLLFPPIEKTIALASGGHISAQSSLIEGHKIRTRIVALLTCASWCLTSGHRQFGRLKASTKYGAANIN